MLKRIHGVLLLLSMFSISPVAWGDDGKRPAVNPPAGELVCIGDSITAGSLASLSERCYVSQLQRLATKTHVNLQVINRGLSGFSTGAYSYKPEEKATHIPSDASLITLMLGTNDTRDKGSPDAIATSAAGNLERLISAYQARAPGAKIVLITPPALYPEKFTKELRGAGYDEAGPEKLRAIDKAYQSLATKLHLQFIDISGVMPSDDTPEGVHPNDLGHARIALFIWRALGGNTSGITPEALAQESDRPQLTFEHADVQSRIGTVYRDALTNLLDINTVKPNKAGDQDPLGWMSDPPGTFIRAGGGYNSPWTRDTSLNSWFAASLLEPAAARNTLWAVCQKQNDKTVLINQDNQWWDQCIWVKGAWNHYCVTGDRAFLEAAYPVAAASLEILRKKHFNSQYGLYMGPAFFADGIAAYPPPEYDATIRSGFVLDHPHTSELMVLSTNCVYREAYHCAALMAKAMDRPTAEASDFANRSDSLKEAINQHLWSPEKEAYAYFLPSAGPDAGKPFFAQEGAGQSFALLFDVADRQQAALVIKKMHSEPHGVVTLWPNLPQFDDEHLGRHNVMIWPLVNGLWALATAKRDAVGPFADEVSHVAELVSASNHHFFEIYNPRSGKPDGGWQGGHWGPVPDQTWSATAYIAAIHQGLFGMNFAADGIHFAPVLPPGWGPVTLAGIPYRQMKLTVQLQGQGTHIEKMTLDGKTRSPFTVPPGLTGEHRVEIILKTVNPGDS